MSQDLKILQTKFESHIESNRKDFINILNSMKAIKKDVTTIKDNHLHDIDTRLTKVEVKMDGMMKLMWIIVGGVIGGLIADFYKLIT